jgi:hypothetical protein
MGAAFAFFGSAAGTPIQHAIKAKKIAGQSPANLASTNRRGDC